MADKNLKNNTNPADPAENSLAVKRSGKQVAKLQQRIKVTKWILFSLLLLVIILYLLFIFFWRGGLGTGNDYGDFTVKINEGQRNMISLSETDDFTDPKTFLMGTSLEDMWHCTRDWIPADIHEQVSGGAHSSIEPSYLAYTFHVRNMSTEDIIYKYDLDLENKYIDDTLEAVRVMIIKNGESVVWANPAKDGALLEPNTFEFSPEPDLMEQAGNDLKVGTTDRFTVVMWFEGEDPECVNDIFYGKLKFSMNFIVENFIKNTSGTETTVN
ncbi:MAG: hypothetical protein IJB24_03675 [Clostridia bacterium]|nr:hypothetical protein [Clostridia bacterium]